MLNLKNKFLKIIFTLLFAFFSSQSALGMESAPPVDKKYYAKVVFLGYFGAGKTVLYEFLTDQLKTIKNKEHSTNIDASEVEYDVDGKKVRVFFFDTSAEPRHKEVMDSFCKNADIVIAVVNATKLLLITNNPLIMTPEEEHFEKLLCRIRKIAPKCRIIVVVTQKSNINSDNKESIKSRVKLYIDNIDNYLKPKKSNNSDSDSDDDNYQSVHQDGKYLNIDATYDLTLHDDKLGTEKTLKHKNKLEDLITESLRKYGVENLQDNSKGFAAKILEHTIYKQNTYLWGLIEGEKEKDKTECCLNYNDNKTSSQSTVVNKKCAIF